MMRARQAIGSHLSHVWKRLDTARDVRVDKYLVWTFFALVAIGVAAVYSAVTYLAQQHAGGDTERLLFAHLFRVGLGIGAMMLFSVIDYHILARWSRYMLMASLVLLVFVKLAGMTAGGATRWLRLGSIGFQPSDLARLSLVLYVAVLLVQKQTYIKDFSRAFAPIFFWILLTAALIGMEDLSTAAVLVCTAALMCFIGRVHLLHLFGLVLMGGLLAYSLILVSPERAARIESYLGMKLFPHTQTEHVFDVRGEGYQQRQAEIAFARGGLIGVGPGKSVQRDFLPASYNDFIYAIIAEEYGILGALGLLALFVVLLVRGFLFVARFARDPLGYMMATGITLMLVLYGFVNAGVASGLLPVTGLPMPFVSYGGTSLLVTGVMAGILLNISRQRPR